MRLPTFYEQNLIPNWGKVIEENEANKAASRIRLPIN